MAMIFSGCSCFRPSALLGLLLLCVAGLASCKPTEDETRTGVSLTGIDHLADHLSVQEFSVDGISGAQAGKGGSTVCCASIPKVWKPGTTVRIKWNVTNWRDCKGEEFEAVVPVEKYQEPAHMYVHFFPGGTIRVVTSDYYPEGASSPTSKYPVKDPIPQKEPWKMFPPFEHCKESFE